MFETVQSDVSLLPNLYGGDIGKFVGNFFLIIILVAAGILTYHFAYVEKELAKKMNK